MRRDGGWGWVVVGSTFILRFILDGIMYSNGLLYLEFLAEFGKGKAETSWVISLQGAFKLFTGMIVAVLIDKLGCRPVVMLGSLTAAVGFAANMFAHNFYVLYFTFGILPACWIVMEPVIIADIFRDNNFNRIYGAIMLLACVPALLGTPLCGWLYDIFGNYEAPFITAGLEYAASGILICIIPIQSVWRNRKSCVTTKSREMAADDCTMKTS